MITGDWTRTCVPATHPRTRAPPGRPRRAGTNPGGGPQAAQCGLPPAGPVGDPQCRRAGAECRRHGPRRSVRRRSGDADGSPTGRSGPAYGGASDCPRLRRTPSRPTDRTSLIDQPPAIQPQPSSPSHPAPAIEHEQGTPCPPHPSRERPPPKSPSSRRPPVQHEPPGGSSNPGGLFLAFWRSPRRREHGHPGRRDSHPVPEVGRHRPGQPDHHTVDHRRRVRAVRADRLPGLRPAQ